MRGTNRCFIQNHRSIKQHSDNMKKIISILLLSAFTVTGLAADKVKQMKKTSDELLDVPKEVVAYYLQLTENDADVQKQVERLTAHSRNENGGLFKLSEAPRAFEWLPMTEDMTIDTYRQQGHFLVVQTAGRWRTKDSDADMALVAEFDVDYDADFDENKKGGMKLTITFLGFRKLALSPVASK